MNTRAKDFPGFVKAYSEAKVLPKSGGRGSGGEEETAEPAIEAKEVAPVVEQLQNCPQEPQAGGEWGGCGGLEWATIPN